MGMGVITRNNQLTISKDVRDQLGLKIGDKMIATVEKGKVVLEKLEIDPVERAFGRWKGMKEESTEYVKKLREAGDRAKTLWKK